MVDIVLKILDVNPKHAKDPSDDVSARCNPIYVGRVLSAMVGPAFFQMIRMQSDPLNAVFHTCTKSEENDFLPQWSSGGGSVIIKELVLS